MGKQFDAVFKVLPGIKQDGWNAGRNLTPDGTEPCDFPTIAREEQAPAEWLARWIRDEGIKTVVDVGCGPGIYVAALRGEGLEAVGWDHDARLPQEPHFTRVDVTNPGAVVGTVTADLALCLEVGEHLPPEKAPALVETLVGIAPTILFSAARPGQGGIGHINCQPPEYWLALFAQSGYTLNATRTDQLRAHLLAGPHMGWLTQNGMILEASHVES